MPPIPRYLIKQGNWLHPLRRGRIAISTLWGGSKTPNSSNRGPPSRHFCLTSSSSHHSSRWGASLLLRFQQSCICRLLPRASETYEISRNLLFSYEFRVLMREWYNSYERVRQPSLSALWCIFIQRKVGDLLDSYLPIVARNSNSSG